MSWTGSNSEKGTMEAFGIDFDKENLMDLFTTSVFCLESGTNRVSDATEVLDLCILRLRLIRWGKAIDINKDPALTSYDLDLEELQETRMALFDIIRLFDTGEPGSNTAVVYASDKGEEAHRLQDLLGAIASKRPLGGRSLIEPHSFGLTRWSKEQSQQVCGFIEHLERLFVPPKLRDLSTEDWLDINRDQAVVKLLTERFEVFGKSLDPWMSNNIIGENPNSSNYTFLNNIVAGYQYNNAGSGFQTINMGAGSQIIMHSGNAFQNGWGQVKFN